MTMFPAGSLSYTVFRDQFTAAFRKLPFWPGWPPIQPQETIHVDDMSWSYHLPVWIHSDGPGVAVFCRADVTWAWTPLHSARYATIEEDMLAELGLGEVVSIADDVAAPEIIVRVDLAIKLRRTGPCPPPKRVTAWLVHFDRKVEEVWPVVKVRSQRERYDRAYHGFPAPRFAVEGEPERALQFCGAEVELHRFLTLPRNRDMSEDQQQEHEEVGLPRQLELLADSIRQMLVVAEAEATAWHER